MYTKEQVDEMLSEVEKEISIAFETMNKNENEITEEVESEEIEAAAEESLDKSEEVEEASEEEFEETIDDLYASMTKSEKEAHYASVKKALFGEEEVEEEVEMAKSEETEEVDNQEEEMIKSENETLKSENAELKKSLDELNGLLDKLFNKEKSAPKGKALTGYDVINKSEEEKESKEDVIKTMKKSEVTKKLNNLDYSKLSKSDRNAINEYCLENGSVDKVKHLIME